MALHGKKSRLAVGGFIFDFANMARMALSKDLAPAETFGLEEHLSESGMRKGTYTFRGLLLPNKDAVKKEIAEMVSNTDGISHIIFCPEGWGGLTAFISRFRRASFEVSGDTGSVTIINGTIESYGGSFMASLLVSPEKKVAGKLVPNNLSASGVGDVFDRGVTTAPFTAQGWRAQMHLLNTIDPAASVVVVIKDSDAADKSAPNTVATFASMGTNDSQFALSTDSTTQLRRYVWAEWTVTGGVTPGIQLAVALAGMRGTQNDD